MDLHQLMPIPTTPVPQRAFDIEASFVDPWRAGQSETAHRVARMCVDTDQLKAQRAVLTLAAEGIITRAEVGTLLLSKLVSEHRHIVATLEAMHVARSMEFGGARWAFLAGFFGERFWYTPAGDDEAIEQALLTTAHLEGIARNLHIGFPIASCGQDPHHIRMPQCCVTKAAVLAFEQGVSLGETPEESSPSTNNPALTVEDRMDLVAPGI